MNCGKAIKIDYRHVDIYHKLSQGAQGEVYMAHYGGNVFALKRMKEKYEAERIDLMAKLQHKNLIELL